MIFQQTKAMNYKHIYLMRNELELKSAKFGLGERGRPGPAGGKERD